MIYTQQVFNLREGDTVAFPMYIEGFLSQVIMTRGPSDQFKIQLSVPSSFEREDLRNNIVNKKQPQLTAGKRRVEFEK